PGVAATHTEPIFGQINGQISAQFQGSDVGMLSVRINTDNQLLLRVGDLLALVEHKMDKRTFDSLSASESASEYVSLESLQEAGFTFDFDAAQDRLIFGLK